MTSEENRPLGALLGLAVGDALGTTLEFTRPTPQSFASLLTGPHTRMMGGGPFKVAPGQVTDDTHRACCLAESLLANGGMDLRDVTSRYVEWSRVAFDIGNLTSDALKLAANALKIGANPQNAGAQAWIASGRQAASNGSLMATAPIGVYYARRRDDRLDVSCAESAITHFDPRCQLACAAFNAAIAAGLDADRSFGWPGDGVASAMGAAAAYTLGLCAMDRGRPENLDASRALMEDINLAAAADPLLYGPDLHMHEQMGFVRVSFRLAFWELAHAPSFEAGLVDVVNRGGDSDTNGAIAGALLGARFGASAIPAAWRNAVLGALQDGPPGPFRDKYHPKTLLRLAAR